MSGIKPPPFQQLVSNPSVGMYSHQMIHDVLIEVTVDDQMLLSGQCHSFCQALLKQRGSWWGARRRPHDAAAVSPESKLASSSFEFEGNKSFYTLLNLLASASIT